ncbi:MAG: rRNA maturation RNase YbeY [Rugosibacter sp.]|nr:rRNA maturation RNase YbeY [Rugosibacter sp.]
MAQRLPELHLAVQYPGGKHDAPTRAQVRRWVRAACPLPAEITVRFVDAAEGQALNHHWRGKDYATNVLSFPYQQEPMLHGDLVICSSVVLREAAEQNKQPEARFAHLIVHGMLHLQGFDHETSAADATLMETREREILSLLSYSDPYC